MSASPSRLTFGLVGGSTYRVSGFQNVVTANGAYTLTVSAAGVTDLAGHAGVGSASDSWTLEVPLTVLDVVDVAPDPRNTTVGGADVVFNHDVDPTTFN